MIDDGHRGRAGTFGLFVFGRLPRSSITGAIARILFLGSAAKERNSLINRSWY